MLVKVDCKSPPAAAAGAVWAKAEEMNTGKLHKMDQNKESNAALKRQANAHRPKADNRAL
jgi:hypothetical protein